MNKTPPDAFLNITHDVATNRPPEKKVKNYVTFQIPSGTSSNRSRSQENTTVSQNIIKVSETNPNEINELNSGGISNLNENESLNRQDRRIIQQGSSSSTFLTENKEKSDILLAKIKDILDARDKEGKSEYFVLGEKALFCKVLLIIGKDQEKKREEFTQLIQTVFNFEKNMEITGTNLNRKDAKFPNLDFNKLEKNIDNFTVREFAEKMVTDQIRFDEKNEYRVFKACSSAKTIAKFKEEWIELAGHWIDYDGQTQQYIYFHLFSRKDIFKSKNLRIYNFLTFGGNDKSFHHLFLISEDKNNILGFIELEALKPMAIPNPDPTRRNETTTQ